MYLSPPPSHYILWDSNVQVLLFWWGMLAAQLVNWRLSPVNHTGLPVSPDLFGSKTAPYYSYPYRQDSSCILALSIYSKEEYHETSESVGLKRTVHAQLTHLPCHLFSLKKIKLQNQPNQWAHINLDGGYHHTDLRISFEQHPQKHHGSFWGEKKHVTQLP